MLFADEFMVVGNTTLEGLVGSNSWYERQKGLFKLALRGPLRGAFVALAVVS